MRTLIWTRLGSKLTKYGFTTNLKTIIVMLADARALFGPRCHARIPGSGLGFTKRRTRPVRTSLIWTRLGTQFEIRVYTTLLKFYMF